MIRCLVVYGWQYSVAGRRGETPEIESEQVSYSWRAARPREPSGPRVAPATRNATLILRAKDAVASGSLRGAGGRGSSAPVLPLVVSSERLSTDISDRDLRDLCVSQAWSVVSGADPRLVCGLWHLST